MKFVENYAKIIYEKIETDKEKYFKKISELVLKLEPIENLNNFLSNESIPVQNKIDLITNILQKWDLEFIKEEVCVIFLLNRSSFFFKILKFTLNLLGEDAKIERVKILTAFKMTKKEISKILSNMQKHNKKKYTYVQIIDKKLIGGFIVKTKDFVYNNSIKYKLDLIRQGKINIDEK